MFSCSPVNGVMLVKADIYTGECCSCWAKCLPKVIGDVVKMLWGSLRVKLVYMYRKFAQPMERQTVAHISVFLCLFALRAESECGLSFAGLGDNQVAIHVCLCWDQYNV